MSKEEAAELYRAFARDSLSLLLRALDPEEIQIAYAGADGDSEPGWLRGGIAVEHFAQEGADLGERLRRAFERSLRQASLVVIIGSDTPHLDPREITRAFDALERKDMVLGPAEDGGYYLIGLKSPQPRLFADIPWSTARVLGLTLERAEELRLSTELLPAYRDIDTADDLSQLAGLEETTPLAFTRKVLSALPDFNFSAAGSTPGRRRRP